MATVVRHGLTHIAWRQEEFLSKEDRWWEPMRRLASRRHSLSFLRWPRLALGQRRAEGVRRYLVQTGGFSEERVRAVSYGEAPERLVFPDRAGPNEGVENRRVALVVEHLGMSEASLAILGGSL